MTRSSTPTGHERTFEEDDIIVSKTDREGKITYANDVFLRVAGYEEDEVLGAPHSMIRHPEMPRSVFKFLWDRIRSGEEIFAYVVNLAKNGDHYWVFAHVTPTFDAAGHITGYHSNRRLPRRSAVATVKGLYASILAAERRESSKADQIRAGTSTLTEALAKLGTTYDELMFQLEGDSHA